jgi:hypothetical protein
MRKLLLSFFGLASLIATMSAPALAFPAPVVRSPGLVIQADYYYGHHHYRHRRWEAHNHHWHYYD